MLWISPSRMVMMRSPIAPIPALWVITTTVVPISWFTLASTSSTRFPVLKSSAPVGSSQKSTSGRLAMARAMATRCCCPPDN